MELSRMPIYTTSECDIIKSTISQPTTHYHITHILCVSSPCIEVIILIHSIRALHGQYIYSFVPVLFGYEALCQRIITFAASIEVKADCRHQYWCYIFRWHVRRPSPPSMDAWVQEDSPCRHSQMGVVFNIGEGEHF